jgi:biotin carboxyl carrier protein
MEYRYKRGDESYTVQVTEQGGHFEVAIGERYYRVRAREVGPSLLEMWVDGEFHIARHAEQGQERWLSLGGATYHLERVQSRRKRHHAGEGKDALEATMPGQVVQVLVNAGDAVERGQLLILLEAMKMELRVTAPHDGTVAQVLVGEGDAVERGATLLEMGQ